MTLNSQQQKIFDEIVEFRKTAKKKFNFDVDGNIIPGMLFVSGAAGTGKSKLLTKIVNFFNIKEPGSCEVVSLSAVAARNVQGKTIHSAFRMNFKSQCYSSPVFENNLKVLIIDEISMVSDIMFDSIQRSLRLKYNRKEPFGGIRVVCFGDLYQLEPINNKVKHEEVKHEDENILAVFKSQNWRHFAYRELTQNMRQNEEDFIQHLNLLRVGKQNKDVVNYFNKFVKPITIDDKLNALSLVTTRAHASRLNTEMYNFISKGKETFKYSIKSKIINIPKKELDFAYAANQKDAIFCNNISLCVGTRIMFTNNDPEKKYCNGQTGFVTDVSDCYIAVEINAGFERKYTISIQPVTLLFKLQNETYNSKKNEFAVEQVTGFPINYAWACTIHKVQGVTTDKLIIESNNMFANGQLYVAISRITHSSGIALGKKILESSILVNPEVSEEYKRLRSISG